MLKFNQFKVLFKSRSAYCVMKCYVQQNFFSWYDREHIPINEAFDNQTFNQFIFAAEDESATTTTYTIAPWTKGPFFGVNAPQKLVRYRIFDFYKLKNGKIW